MILVTDILHEVIPEVVWRDDQAAEVDEGGHVPVYARVTCHVDRSNVTHIMENGSLVMFTILRLFRERLHTSPTSSSTCSPATRVCMVQATCHYAVTSHVILTIVAVELEVDQLQSL